MPSGTASATAGTAATLQAPEATTTASADHAPSSDSTAKPPSPVGRTEVTVVPARTGAPPSPP